MILLKPCFQKGPRKHCILQWHPKNIIMNLRMYHFGVFLSRSWIKVRTQVLIAKLFLYWFSHYTWPKLQNISNDISKATYIRLTDMIWFAQVFINIKLMKAWIKNQSHNLLWLTSWLNLQKFRLDCHLDGSYQST